MHDGKQPARVVQMERRKKDVPLFSLRESQIQRAIMDLLAAEHVRATRFNTGYIRDHRGVPIQMHSGGKGFADIQARPIVRGMFGDKPVAMKAVLWIEVKGPKGKQTPEQLSFQQSVEEDGEYYLLAYSSDDVLAWLRSHGVSR